MIISINEFKLSNHYVKDTDNRFETRIKKAKLKNKDIKNLDKANERFKKALYFHGLETMDKLNIFGGLIGIVFGNIYFREDGRIKPAIIEVDNERKGNVYVAIVRDRVLVTMLLMPMSTTNSSIADKIKDHERRNGRDVEDVVLYDLSGDELKDKTGTKRKPIMIDLDMKEDEFNKLYPYPILSKDVLNNITGLSDYYKDQVSKMKERETVKYAYIPINGKIPIEEKEFVIYEGLEILFKTSKDREPEEKIITYIHKTDVGNKTKIELEFKGSPKRYEIKIGDRFIISPKIQNQQYRSLIDAFDLEDGKDISFSGPIVRFMNYKKGKGGSNKFKLGVVIKPVHVI